MKPSRRAFLGLAQSGGERARVLVTVFLRGAADALNLVVPFTEERYYQLRPNLALPRPDSAKAQPDERARPLDERFALHPALAALIPAWENKELAVVHAVGSDDQTRSHFEAQDRMEHAGPEGQDLGSGWLARHLRSSQSTDVAALGAVALSPRMPESLRGAPAAAVLESVDEYQLGERPDASFFSALSSLYEVGGAGLRGQLQGAGRETLQSLERLSLLRGAGLASSAAYPAGNFSQGLREVARLIRADVGLRVACVDLEGWDTHFVQAKVFPGLAQQLGRGLAAFRADLGERLADVTVVVMTEFGRRAYENTSFGTDHGRAGLMLLLGGGVRGGRVVTDWPGLGAAELEEPGDLRVTIDYRDVLAEVLEQRFGNTHLDRVFPGYSPTRRGVIGQP